MHALCCRVSRFKGSAYRCAVCQRRSLTRRPRVKGHSMQCNKEACMAKYAIAAALAVKRAARGSSPWQLALSVVRYMSAWCARRQKLFP